MLINSLLVNDLYSFTQQQAILHQFPAVDVEYQFKCRNNVDLVPYLDQIRQKIDQLCTLRFTEEELLYLASIPFIKKNYIEFLRTFQLQRDYVDVFVDAEDKLAITIKGNWFHTVLFEVPILAIVSEVCLADQCQDLTMARQWLNEKIKTVKSYFDLFFDTAVFKFADFGLRRRFSGEWQDEIVATLVRELPRNFIGTSNVYLANKYNVKPIGTMSHQWLMIGQGLPNVRLSESQRFMLDAWVREYRGDLGIALSDTLGFDAFLKDFDPFFAKLYDGCRHDSGDPYQWCERLIVHYEKLKIDPITKTAVFSDGLTFREALRLCKTFDSRIKTSFGIGTSLTNDCGVKPLQNVIKLVKVNSHPVAKISDSPGKGMCQDEEYLKYLKSVFNEKDT